MLSLYPRGETETPAPDTSNLVQLALIHPRTNSLCMFLLDEAQIKYAFFSHRKFTLVVDFLKYKP
jgi:hypothetical protein